MDPKIQAQADSVKAELSGAEHLTPEHRDLLNLQVDEALECANGTPDKLGKIANVVALSAIRSARGDIRLESRITKELVNGLAGMKEDIRGVITAAMAEHINNCPMANPDYAKLKKSLGIDAEDGSDDTKIFGIKAKAAAHWAKVLDSSPMLTGIAALFLIYKIVTAVISALGSEGVKETVAKLF